MQVHPVEKSMLSGWSFSAACRQKKAFRCGIRKIVHAEDPVGRLQLCGARFTVAEPAPIYARTQVFLTALSPVVAKCLLCEFLFRWVEKFDVFDVIERTPRNVGLLNSMSVFLEIDRHMFVDNMSSLRRIKIHALSHRWSCHEMTEAHMQRLYSHSWRHLRLSNIFFFLEYLISRSVANLSIQIFAGRSLLVRVSSCAVKKV